MTYPRTHVEHRDPDHHEAIHPVRNIGNAHVVAGEFLTSRYHDALQTVLHPLGESLDTHDQHALNDLGIVHANDSLNDLSPIVRSYVRLDDYWTRTHRTALNELFADRRAHVLSFLYTQFPITVHAIYTRNRIWTLRCCAGYHACPASRKRLPFPDRC